MDSWIITKTFNIQVILYCSNNNGFNDNEGRVDVETVKADDPSGHVDSVKIEMLRDGAGEYRLSRGEETVGFEASCRATNKNGNTIQCKSPLEF